MLFHLYLGEKKQKIATTIKTRSYKTFYFLLQYTLCEHGRYTQKENDAEEQELVDRDEDDGAENGKGGRDDSDSGM